MQAQILLAFCVLAASAALGGLTPSLRRDSDFGTNVPGKQDKGLWGPNDYPLSYPDPSVLFKWNQKSGPCEITLIADVSRCIAGNFRYKNQYIPYNDESAKQLEGHVNADFKIDDNDYYTKWNFTATDVFRGRLMLTDQAENNKYTGLMSVRVDTSAGESRAWIDAEIDEETKQNRKKIAGVSYLYWGSQKEVGQKTTYMGDDRGFKKTLKTTRLIKDTLFVQWC